MLESSPDKYADRAEKRLNANEEMFMAEEFSTVRDVCTGRRRSV